MGFSPAEKQAVIRRLKAVEEKLDKLMAPSTVGNDKPETQPATKKATPFNKKKG